MDRWELGLTRRGASCTEHVCKSLARRLQISTCSRSNVDFQSACTFQKTVCLHKSIRCGQAAATYRSGSNTQAYTILSVWNVYECKVILRLCCRCNDCSSLSKSYRTLKSVGKAYPKLLYIRHDAWISCVQFLCAVNIPCCSHGLSRRQGPVRKMHTQHTSPLPSKGVPVVRILRDPLLQEPMQSRLSCMFASRV